MVDKQYSLDFCSCDIVSVDLYKSEHYKYASIGINKGKKHFISISYGWEGDKIPDFILDMAAFFASSGEGKENAAINEDSKAEFDTFMKRLLTSKTGK